MNESKHTRQWKSPWFRLRLFFILESGMEVALRFLVWVFLCSCSWFRSTNCSWHRVHLGTGHNPICLVSEAISCRIRWHLGHYNRMARQMDWCCFKLSLRLNVLPQSGHSCFTLTWWCVLFICLTRLLFLLNVWSHTTQTCWGSILLKLILLGLIGNWASGCGGTVFIVDLYIDSKVPMCPELPSIMRLSAELPTTFHSFPTAHTDSVLCTQRNKPANPSNRVSHLPLD